MAEAAVQQLPNEAQRIAIVGENNIRGKDRKKMDWDWVAPILVFESAKPEYKGWGIYWLNHPDDLAQFGKAMGHCSGTHYVWASEELIWFFFTLMDPKGIPHTTMFCKDTEWATKVHPRMSCPTITGEKVDSCGYYGAYGKLRAAGGGYITHADVVAYFKGEGRSTSPVSIGPQHTATQRMAEGLPSLL